MIDPNKFNLPDIITWVFISVVGFCSTWIMALRRKVNTNEAQIKQDRLAHEAQMALIMQRLDARDSQRDDDRAVTEQLGEDVRELRTDIREIKNALIAKK